MCFCELLISIERVGDCLCSYSDENLHNAKYHKIYHNTYYHLHYYYHHHYYYSCYY